MQYSADVLPNVERIGSCKLTERAKVSMEAVCDVITTSQPHFVFCLRPYKVKQRSRESNFRENHDHRMKTPLILNTC